MAIVFRVIEQLQCKTLICKYNLVLKSSSTSSLLVQKTVKNVVLVKLQLLEFAELILWIVLQLREQLHSQVSWIVVAQVQLCQMGRVGL